MEKDREKWNEKYSSGQFPWTEPSPIVKEFYTLAKGKKALDLACGTGRNAIFLAEKGFTVDAVDISDVALKELKKKNPAVNTINADLDFYRIPENKYNLIININYLNREIIPCIKESLKKDGVIIFETFTLTEGGNYFQPENKKYMLRKNELLHLFMDFYVVFYEEKVKIKPDNKKAFVSSLVGIKRY